MLKNLISSTRFETETEIMGKAQQLVEENLKQLPDHAAIKSEVYEYVQSKLKQLATSNTLKFTTARQQIESLEERVKNLGDLNNDNDFQFDEFKDQITLKHNILLESVTNGHQTIAHVKQRVQDQQVYMLRMKKSVTELQKSKFDTERLEAIEQKLSGDFIQNLIQLQASQCVEDKLKEAKFPNLISSVEDKIAHFTNVVKNVEHEAITQQ